MNYRLMSAFLATNEPADAFRRTPHELGLKGNLNRDPRNIAARARIYAWLAAPPRRCSINEISQICDVSRSVVRAGIAMVRGDAK